MIAFAVSEITLLFLYGFHVMGATLAAVVANLVATVPSYLMSRYWIWSASPRARVGRQVVMYWTTSLLCITGTKVVGAVLDRNGLRPARYWVTKDQRVIFATDRPQVSTVPAGRAGRQE